MSLIIFYFSLYSYISQSVCEWREWIIEEVEWEPKYSSQKTGFPNTSQSLNIPQFNQQTSLLPNVKLKPHGHKRHTYHRNDDKKALHKRSRKNKTDEITEPNTMPKQHKGDRSNVR